MSAFSSADPNTIATVLYIKGVISTEAKAQISQASISREKATLLIITAIETIKCSPEKI